MALDVSSHRLRAAVLLTLASSVALVQGTVQGPVAAAHDNQVRNGGFETGTLAGWERSNVRPFPVPALWFATPARFAPFSGLPLLPPAQGRFQAVLDQTGPASNVLYQDIEVEDDDDELRLTVWYVNYNEVFHTPRTLNAGIPEANQQLRIDVIRPSAPLRTLRAEDVLATMLATRAGDEAAVGPTVVRADLGEFEGQTVRLRIAEVDNQFFFTVGVDAVRVVEAGDDHDDASGTLRSEAGTELGTTAVPRVPYGG